MKNYKKVLQANTRFLIDYKTLYRLNNIKRYSTRFNSILKESVSEHTTHVSIIVMRLIKKLIKHGNTYAAHLIKLYELEIIKYALIHDVDEVLVNDIPYTFISDEIKNEIHNLTNKYTAELSKYLGAPEHPEPIVKDVVKLADIISVYFYAKANLEILGETNKEFLEIKAEAFERIKTTLKRIKSVGF